VPLAEAPVRLLLRNVVIQSLIRSQQTILLIELFLGMGTCMACSLCDIALCRARLAGDGSPEQDLPLHMFPSPPSFIRQQRSRRSRRPDFDSAPRYLSYDHSEHPPASFSETAPSVLFMPQEALIDEAGRAGLKFVVDMTLLGYRGVLLLCTCSIDGTKLQWPALAPGSNNYLRP
jgi:hypothetical protein